jgi:hypothetical protein
MNLYCQTLQNNPRAKTNKILDGPRGGKQALDDGFGAGAGAFRPVDL